MAPEQVRAQTVDHRADIFAFGAILYEMLSGQRAFAGASAADTMSAILERNPPPDARLMAAPIRVVQGAIDAATPVALFCPRLSTGSNVLTFGYNSAAQYAVAPDGRFLINITAEETVTAPITIVLNWTAGLKK